jgi:O-antigen/teichoic acid export membrane protein
VALGPEFADAHVALAILCVGQLVNAGCGFTGVILEMTGRELDATIGVATGLFTNIVLNAALIPGFGISGAAVATAAGLLVWNLMLVWAIRRRLGIRVTALAALVPRTTA